MKKIYFILLTLLCHAYCFAQNTVDEMNDIKLSGQYFTGEATGATEAEATQMALSNLIEMLANYCEDTDCAMVDETTIASNVKSMKMQRGDKQFVLLYVLRSIVNSTQSAPAAQPAQSMVNEPTTQDDKKVVFHPNVSISSQPDIIQRICTLESFSGLEAVLDFAQNTGNIVEYGKYKSISNPDACYLVMVNRDRAIVAVLSPKTGGIRTNLKNGTEVNSEGMKNFMYCVPICVRTK